MHDPNPYLIYSSLPETRHFARAEGTYPTLEAAQAAASRLVRAGREVVIAREEWRAGRRMLGGLKRGPRPAAIEEDLC